MRLRAAFCRGHGPSRARIIQNFGSNLRPFELRELAAERKRLDMNDFFYFTKR